MLTRPVFTFLLSAVVLLSPWGVEADAGDEGTMFSIQGYGTVGFAHSSDSKADYIGVYLRPTGAGHTRDWSAAVDSRLGVQVNADFSHKLSAVLQVISQQRHDDSYRPTIEWANIKYQFTPDFSVRLGRTIQPSFLFADSRKIGYTYPWVRPPAELYNLIPISSNDGIDLMYRLHVGEMTNTVGITYGGVELKVPESSGGGSVKVRKTVGFVNILDHGPLTFRVTYYQSRPTVEALLPLFDAFRQLGPEGIAIAERYGMDNTRARFFGLGVSYDPGDWFTVTEWGISRSPSVFAESRAWYLSGGYRFGTLTPYASYAQLNVFSDTSVPGLSLSGLPTELTGVAAGLNAGFNAVLSAAQAQKTTAIGLRWDFQSSTALKLQYETIRRDSGSPGLFVNLQPGFRPGGDAELFSASIDFVF